MRARRDFLTLCQMCTMVQQASAPSRIEYFGGEAACFCCTNLQYQGVCKTGRVFDHRVYRFAQFLETKVQRRHLGYSHSMACELLMLVATLRYDSDPERFLDERELSEEHLQAAAECMRNEAVTTADATIEKSMGVARETAKLAFEVYAFIKEKELVRLAQGNERRRQRRELREMLTGCGPQPFSFCNS